MKTIHPPKTKADYERAISEIARYFEKEPAVGSPDAFFIAVAAVFSCATP